MTVGRSLGARAGDLDPALYDRYSERASAFVKAFEAAVQHGVVASRAQLRKAADDLMGHRSRGAGIVANGE